MQQDSGADIHNLRNCGGCSETEYGHQNDAAGNGSERGSKRADRIKSCAAPSDSVGVFAHEAVHKWLNSTEENCWRQQNGERKVQGDEVVGWEGKVNSVDGAGNSCDEYFVESDRNFYQRKVHEWLFCGVGVVAQCKCTDGEAQQKRFKYGRCGIES